MKAVCSFGCLAGLVLAAGCLPPTLRAQETELKDGSGKTIAHYVVEAPAGVAPAGTTDPARQVGLIFCFQEHAHPTGDDMFPVRESLRRLGLSDQYVLLAAHSQDPAGKMGPADHEPIMKLLAWAEKTYPVNPRRVYMYGKGEGGKISGEFAVMHPELVTAGITYSWGWWTMPTELAEPIDPVNRAPEFYMVLGLRDYSHHISTVRDTYERVKFKGYHVIYREFEELGERSYHPATNDDAVAWATRLRNKNIPVSAAEANLLKPFGKGAPPAPVDGYYPTLALVGGAPAGVVVQKLLAAGDANIRAAAAQTCSHAIFGEPTTAVLGKLLADPSPKVRHAALNALASYAAWRSEAAQQALIQRALDKNLDFPDRMDAADALAQAVKFQATGVRQDPPMFRALVALDHEKYEQLQAIAFLALAPVRKYKIGGADEGQSPPEGGWEKWLDGITAEQEGDLAYYGVCGSESHSATEPVELFCGGAANLNRNPARAFQSTLQAAQRGYVPAEEMVGMMYATAKGVEQNYLEAGKWFLAAAEAGDARSAVHYAGALRSGMGNLRRDPDLSARWTKFIAAHPEYAPPRTR